MAHTHSAWYPLNSYCEHAELLRENKRMLDKAIRDLDRERMGLQTQEKKLVAEIKKTAKQGQMVCETFILPTTLSRRVCTICTDHLMACRMP